MLLKNKTRKAQSRTVNFDAYGNAIPDTPSVKNETSTVAASIVETREIMITPRRSSSPAPSRPAKKSILKTLTSWRSKSSSVAVVDTDVSTDYIPKQELQPHPAHQISEVLELGFQKLHAEFNRREQQMELRFQALSQQHQHKAVLKKYWLIPVAVVGALAMGYMLYILTSMQNSMTIMSSSIPMMNQHISEMAQDTQNMSGNMQALNGNVTQMNSSFQQMNQQMGTVSQAVIPMGKAAKTAQPFMSMMRSFMPF